MSSHQTSPILGFLFAKEEFFTVDLSSSSKSWFVRFFLFMCNLNTISGLIRISESLTATHRKFIFWIKRSTVFKTFNVEENTFKKCSIFLQNFHFSWEVGIESDTITHGTSSKSQHFESWIFELFLCPKLISHFFVVVVSSFFFDFRAQIELNFD